MHFKASWQISDRKSSLCIKTNIVTNAEKLIIISDYFTSENNPRCEEFKKILLQLQNDQDRDVRYFSSPVSETRYEEEDNLELEEKVSTFSSRRHLS